MAQNPIGQVFDNYEIRSVLGRGGMGVVYKARNLALDKDVALKVMSLDLAHDEAFLSRFKSEAKSLAMLESPNIVGVYDLRETPLGFCIVMEYVDGRTLADHLRDTGAMAWRDALPIFKQLLGALGHAHKVGVIHRDIKPGNIMLTKSGVVKVADFGLAKIQQQSSATMTMTVGGTLRYMSPEQVMGLRDIDRRSDIFSLGMTLYEVVAGRLPFSENDSDYTIRQSIVEGKLPRPDKINPDIPGKLAKIIMKAIAATPDDRFRDAEEMWEALCTFESGEQTDKTTPGSTGVENGPRRMPVWIKAGVAAILGAVVLVGLFFVLRAPSASRAVEVSIASDPVGAEVLLNGESVGVTPLRGYKLNAGTAQLRLTAPGYPPKDTTLSVLAGAPLVVFLSLGQASGGAGVSPTRPDALGNAAKLILHVVPRGTVTIDSEHRIDAADRPAEVEVQSGQRTVLFTHPDHGAKSVEVDLRPGETRKLTCYFESYVSILAKPVWGSIVIDGRNTGMSTPQARVPLGVGRHRITVNRTGYQTIEGSQVVVVYPTLDERVIPMVFNLEKQ